MPVDVVTEIEIGRPRGVVASYACEPGNATAWYQNIRAADTMTPGPVAAGSRIAFTAVFLGRRLTYTYEVSELVPGERLVMRTSEGPFPMETTYAWRDARPGATLMTLRNRGGPSGLAGLAAPLVARSMRSANRKDLKRLKAILEAGSTR
jgi:hypothetical protein